MQGQGHNGGDMVVGALWLQVTTPASCAGCWGGPGGKGWQVFQSCDYRPIPKWWRTILMLSQLQALENCGFLTLFKSGG